MDDLDYQVLESYIKKCEESISEKNYGRMEILLTKLKVNYSKIIPGYSDGFKDEFMCLYDDFGNPDYTYKNETHMFNTKLALKKLMDYKYSIDNK